MQAGVYFVTICTQQREHLFGEIVNRQMRLNQIGSIVVEEWLQSPMIRPEIENPRRWAKDAENWQGRGSSR